MRATQQDYFRPTPRSAMAGLIIAVPMALFTYYVTNDYVSCYENLPFCAPFLF